MSEIQEQTRHPIDKDFLEMKHKIERLSTKLAGQETKLIKTWLAKLTGTSPKTRNEYVLCLLNQVQSEKLTIPFTIIPEKFTELPPLDEALHGPIPDLSAPKTTTWRRGRGKVESVKKFTQKELKQTYGTDRIGLHTCLKDITDIDNFTIQSLVGLTGPHTKDGGTLLVETMQDDLQEFRRAIQTFYDEHSSIMADQVAMEQIDIKATYTSETASLEKRTMDLEEELKRKNPQFDWNWFKKYNKVDAEQNKKLNKLKHRVMEQEEKNIKVKEIIIEMEHRLAAHTKEQ